MANSVKSITLFRTGPPNGYSWSPFVCKLETRLRLANITHKVAQGSPLSAPRGKIPYVELQHDDATSSKEVLGDTALITKALIVRGLAADLDGGLAPLDKARGLAVQALLEDKLYFYGVREKWWDNYLTMRENSLSAAPWFMRPVIGLIAYRSVSTMLQGQGTGRFTAAEIQTFKEEGWQSLETMLAESRAASKRKTKPFWLLGGTEPTEVDASVYGFIVSSLVCNAAPVQRELVKQMPALVDYASRIHDQYFPEYQKWE